MPDLDFYTGAYSGQQIDTAVSKVINADSTPTANSQNMVTSGGVESALEQWNGITKTISNSITTGKRAEVTLNATNNMGLLYISAAGGNRQGLYIIGTNSSGNFGQLVSVLAVGDSNITVSTSGKVLTIANSTGSYIFYGLMFWRGGYASIAYEDIT